MKIKNKLLTTIILLIISTNYNNVIGQVSITGTAISASDMVGTSNSNDANIVTQQTQKINFFTNGGTTFPWNNQRMTILSSGKVGIGNFTPDYLFDVSSGDINLHTYTNAYRIGDGSTGQSYPVLWHNGHVEDIFVGVGAGNNFMTHHTHVCVGHLSGTRITIGDSLTFVGDESGTTNDTGIYNTAVGCRALFSNRSASNILTGGCFAPDLELRVVSSLS